MGGGARDQTRESQFSARLVGVGLGSNELGAAIALKANAFGTDAVAIVKDVFDRDESRPYLSSVLGVNAAGVVILTVCVDHFIKVIQKGDISLFDIFEFECLIFFV